MKLGSTWTPRLAEIPVSASDKLTAALIEDIAGGLSGPGDRLPAHRELAWHLKVSVGTVTKAYAALARRGLVRSFHGRGMFVAVTSQATRPLIDLSINAPPQMLSDRLLSAALETLARRSDAGMFSAFTPAAGRSEHRLQMARWLSGTGLVCRRENILLTNGAQQALAIAFAVAATPGTTVFTEAFTYPGALLIGRRAGLKLCGIEMDEQGMTADALDKALTEDKSSRQVVYITPTLQNPTTATMSVMRREDIVRVCRDHDAIIVEDDVYSVFTPPDHLPLAAMAPERTFHVTGFSKILSPGLRIGALVAPDWAIGEAESCLQASSTMAAPLSAAIMELWLSDGTAASVASTIRLEAARRAGLAARILSRHCTIRNGNGFHLWLPMPTEKAEELVARAATCGILLMPAAAPLTDPTRQAGGIRVSLGGPSPDQLIAALAALEELLQAPPRPSI